MKITEGHIPLYFQFYLRIKNDILLEEIPLGSKIPSLQQLIESYGVSLITVRKTMDLLEREGLIVRRRGQGTFVKTNIGKLTRGLRPLKDEIKSLNIHDPLDFQPINEGWIEPPVRIKKIFSGREDALLKGRVFNIRRIMAPRRSPHRKRLKNTFIPAWVIKQLNPKEFKKKPVIQVVCETNLWNTMNVTETIRPWICNTEESELLGIQEGTSIFWLSFEFFTPNGDVLFYSESITNINTLIREAVINIDKRSGKIS